MIHFQVKRTDQVGRPEIDNFQTAMKRDGRNKGIFVGFSFSRDAEKEIRRIEREEGLIIEMVTVDELVNKEMNGLMK
jgi:restriction endonuclease Mrr